MINSVLPDVFTLIIAIESTRSERVNGAETNHQVSAPDVKYGILHVWRENREDSPIHAIGVEIWEQNTKIAMVAPVHCAGWLPNQVHEYLRQVLEVLGAEYGFKKFSSSELINPSQRPIRPCHLLCQT